MSSKFEDRAVARLLHRLESRGLNAALEYGLAISGTHPHVANAVLANAPEPLRTMLDAAFGARRVRRKVELDALAKARNEWNQAQHAVEQALAADLDSARRIGQAIVFLAGLTTAERAHSGATKNEIAMAIAMRRSSLRSTKVTAMLGCSVSELRRWSEDGRLPVMFRRRMPSSTAGKSLDVRHWDADLIERSLHSVPQWRAEDALAKRIRRVAK